jgi:diguanylate cyclase (GGDEF)-like protein
MVARRTMLHSLRCSRRESPGCFGAPLTPSMRRPEPSFRNRLAFFFVVIVVLPMVAVTIILFRLVSDSQTGQSDARFSAEAAVATQLFHHFQVGLNTTKPASRIAQDPALDLALARGDLLAAARRGDVLLHRNPGVTRIALYQGSTLLLAVGNPSAIAPSAANLHLRLPANAAGGATNGLPNGLPRALGRLEVSTITATQFVRLASELAPPLQVGLVGDGRVLAASMAGIAPGLAATSNRPRNVRIGPHTYRVDVAIAPAGAFGGGPLSLVLLSDQRVASAQFDHDRLLAGALVGVFFLLALASAFLVSRSLQGQIQDFLAAARRLARGDFSAEVAIHGRDEFAALGQEFNKMSEQLEAQLATLREQGVRIQEVMRRVGETFAANLDGEALREIVLRTAVEGVGASGGRVTGRGPDGQLEERVRVGRVDGLESALLQAETAVLASGEPAHLELAGGGGALAYPLRADGGPLVQGIVSVARLDRSFVAAEGDLFRYLGGQVAVSIENIELHERVQRQAVTDELTGLYNHRRFQETMAAEVERSRRFGQEVGLIMLDIDDFKKVNDAYGHQQGDEVLREVAKVIRDLSREVDSAARYGGEEMAVILPQTGLEGAHNMAERLREGIEELVIRRLDGNGTLNVTASVGVAAAATVGENAAGSLIAAADAALYEAKRSGKNRTAQAR